jgi:CelD/BcsL family acetyltransferase involved in cellulose biosynthesis
MSDEVTIIRDRQALAGFLPAWRAFLASPVTGRNFHNDPANIQTILDSNRRAAPFIVVVRRGGAIRCIAPFFTDRTQFPMKLSVLTLASLPIRLLKLFGDEFICAGGEDARQTFGLVFAALADYRGGFDLVTFYNLDCSGRLFKYCTSPQLAGGEFRFVLASPKVEKVHQVKFVASDHDGYMKSLSPSTRQNLRRTTRKFFSDGKAELVKITKPEQVPAFLAQLDEVCRNAWQGKTFGYHRRNTENGRRQFEHVAREGWLRSYVLVHDRQPVAFELGYQYAGTYYGQECGYDQKWSSTGPGSIVMHLVIEDLFKEDRPDLLDFGFGDAPYKRSFSNTEHDAVAAYLVPANRWRGVIGLQAVLNFVFVQVQTALIKTRLDHVIRRMLKHKR